MLDFPLGAKLHDHFAIEILCIIGHYLVWWTIATNQIFFYKLLHHFLCYMSIRTGFYPFREVVNSYEDESMPVAPPQKMKIKICFLRHFDWRLLFCSVLLIGFFGVAT